MKGKEVESAKEKKRYSKYSEIFPRRIFIRH